MIRADQNENGIKTYQPLRCINVKSSFALEDPIRFSSSEKEIRTLVLADKLCQIGPNAKLDQEIDGLVLKRLWERLESDSPVGLRTIS